MGEVASLAALPVHVEHRLIEPAHLPREVGQLLGRSEVLRYRSQLNTNGSPGTTSTSTRHVRSTGNRSGVGVGGTGVGVGGTGVAVGGIGVGVGVSVGVAGRGVGVAGLALSNPNTTTQWYL